GLPHRDPEGPEEIIATDNVPQSVTELLADFEPRKEEPQGGHGTRSSCGWSGIKRLNHL
ncbi:MAG: hypothetical protein RLZZ265_2143, partial [Verrucomicrobiota bacterium]